MASASPAEGPTNFRAIATMTTRVSMISVKRMLEGELPRIDRK